MILTDYHIHSDYSPDSTEPMENSIRQGIKANLSEIAFTDHLEPIPNTNFFDTNSFDEYIKQFLFLKNKYKDKISLKLGGEITFYTGNEVNSNNFLNSYDFDFIIGSQHSILNKNLYDNFDFTKLNKIDSYNLYLEDMLNCIKVYDFDVIGHFDFISRYSGYKDPKLYFKDHKQLITEIFKVLIQKNKGIEVNLSSIRYGNDFYYPYSDILTHYKKLGGKYITIGSDSHSAVSIGEDFDLVEKYIKSCGFDYVTKYNKRIPELYKI